LNQDLQDVDRVARSLFSSSERAYGCECLVATEMLNCFFASKPGFLNSFPRVRQNPLGNRVGNLR